VYNTLGYGFLEKVYLNAMFIELKEMGLKVEKEKRILVYYFGNIVGDYNADLIVEDIVAVELKAIEMLVNENELQLINYLKATNIEVGLLLNFGKKPQIKRKIFDNDKKPMLK
jgi:GxxExxY protein